MTREVLIARLRAFREEVVENQKRIEELHTELDELKNKRETLPSVEDIDNAIAHWEEIEQGCKKCGKALGGSITWPKGGGGPLCRECA